MGLGETPNAIRVTRIQASVGQEVRSSYLLHALCTSLADCDLHAPPRPRTIVPLFADAGIVCVSLSRASAQCGRRGSGSLGSLES